jgi:predicted nucleic acid-binding protein
VKVLFDTNVVLDVLLAREPFADVAARLFSLVDRGDLDGAICATTVTTVDYIAAKSVGPKKTRELVGRLIGMFEVAAVDASVLERALELEFDDFEDAVVHEAARACGADAIVTRNGRDFARASLRVLDPVELLAAIQASA